jgi:hypothetical protein
MNVCDGLVQGLTHREGMVLVGLVMMWVSGYLFGKYMR